MSNLLQKISFLAVSIGLAVSSLLGFHSAPATPTLGTSAPQFVAAKPTFLYGGGIASTDTSIKLTALVTPGGVPITTAQLVGGPNGVFYATIEPATTKKETISCNNVNQNGDGTAVLTGCSRGLLFTTPYTASSTLALAHSGGSSVVISNSPQVYNDIVNDAVSLTRASTITGQLTLSSTTPPKYDATPIWANFPNTTLATIGLVASATSTGGVPASETIQGTSQLATSIQAASSTSIGSTLARLVLPSSLATSTCQVAQNSVLVSSSTGKLGINCFDQTLGYTLSGANTFTGTTTFNTATTTLNATTSIAASQGNNLILNGLPYSLPSARGASSTALTEDGTGRLSWGVAGGGFATGQSSVTSTSTGVVGVTFNHALGSIPRLFTLTSTALTTSCAISTGSNSSGTATAVGVQSSISLNIGTTGGPSISSDSGIASAHCNSGGADDLWSITTYDSTNVKITLNNHLAGMNWNFQWTAYK